jgi:hypothetical protein
MKLKLYTAAGLISIAGLVSCGGNTDKEVVDKTIIPSGTDTTSTQPATVGTATPGQAIIPSTTVPANTTINPGTISTPVNITQPQTVSVNPQNNTVLSAPQVVQTPVPTVTQPGMNPPHGQPGHRCDISVGAPLNSKPAPANTQPATVSTTPQQPQVTMKEIPTTTKTAPGMNPPHGEPGHKCEIAVGAPLDSKPTSPAANPVQISPPSLITAPKPDSNKN